MNSLWKKIAMTLCLICHSPNIGFENSPGGHSFIRDICGFTVFSIAETSKVIIVPTPKNSKSTEQNKLKKTKTYQKELTNQTKISH